MQKAILAKKLGMTQIFDETGKVIPVTVIEAGPNAVIQKKTVENDGYEAVQVGFVDLKEKKTNKPTKGHFAKAGVTPKKYIKEFRLDDVHRGPMTHGSGYHRGPGSMGMCSDPGRVFKGKRLPGHMGVERVTIQNLTLVKVDAEKNIILIKGGLPGPKGGLLIVKNTVKGRK